MLRKLMLLKTIAHAKRSQKVPLRFVLVVPFVLQIFTAVGLVGYFSERNAHKAINHLATQLQTEVSSRIEQHLDTYLVTPNEINQINADAIELGLLDLRNFPGMGHYFWKQMQVFMNLLANAIDALQEGNIGQSYQEIAVCGNAIAIKTEVSADKTQVVIRIKDNGPGMSDEVKDRIFDHLFTTKAVGKGTGLGLSICRQIVEEKHGGYLKCISSLGKGAEFAIFLPI